jgi:hypothetical protein
MAKKKSVSERVVKKMDERRKPPLGSGERFAALKGQLAQRKGVSNPGALAAYIGRKKYGKKKFAQLSKHGKRG